MNKSYSIKINNKKYINFIAFPKNLLTKILFNFLNVEYFYTIDNEYYGKRVEFGGDRR